MRKRTSFFIFLFLSSLILLSSFSGCLFKPPVTEGVLKGQVIVPEGTLQAKDLTGQALPNATINIIDPATGAIIATTTTDADGYYQVFVPAGGPYILEAVKDGVVVLQITPQVEVGIEYDLGITDCSTTSVALIVQAMLVAEDYPNNIAGINLTDIETDPDFNDVMNPICSTIKAGEDPALSAVVQQAVKDFLYPPAPSSPPSPPPTTTYNVTYNGNGNTGGTVPTDSNSYAQGKSVTVLGNTGDLVKMQDGISLLLTEWNTANDGSGDNYNENDTFNMGSTDVTLYAQWSVIRGTGPAGGLIFYDKGSISDGWRYLEAALSDQSEIQVWSNVTGTTLGTTSADIGTGKANTNKIIEQSGHTASAAKSCDDLSIENNSIIYNDWFLPSKSELNLIYINLYTWLVGGFKFDFYWSSSEYSLDPADFAWGHSFAYGTQNCASKGYPTWVRAVRAFRSTAPTYIVNYNANGATGGTVPSDSYHYEPGETVTVLGNTGDLIRINDGGTSYCFTGWNTKADGSGTDQAEGSTFTMGTSNVILYAQWTPYVLRDTGPAGGLIFYVKEGGYSDGWMYLEAAPSTTEWTGKWGSYSGDGCPSVEIGGTEVGIGTGRSNTIRIVEWLDLNTDNTCGDVTEKAQRAAYLCDALDYGGYDDWFLPSKEELNLMHVNLYDEGVGEFKIDNWYWSSSEENNLYAWMHLFADGSSAWNCKYYPIYVRAIRAF